MTLREQRMACDVATLRQVGERLLDRIDGDKVRYDDLSIADGLSGIVNSLILNLDRVRALVTPMCLVIDETVLSRAVLEHN